MAKEKNMPVVSNPEDIVDLDNIIREGSQKQQEGSRQAHEYTV